MGSIGNFFSRRSPKFYFIQRSFGNRPFRLLDIGAGNHSASKTKRLFPACEYHGLDINKDYNNSPEDFKAMTAFYEMDLTRLQFDVLQNDFFDAIWIVHVIEHLHNGDEVLLRLLPKLKKGGFLYVEFPGKKSTTLPSMYGTLNFHDDASHVRIYSAKEVSSLLEKAGFETISNGTRRNWYYIFAMPFRILGHWARGKKLQGNIFWDLLGFAEFVYGRKR
ncbi:MAG TPA: class I SAM-dependent methyltransferase [Chitinophagaceae bacterium]